MTPREKAIEIHTEMFLVKDELHKYPMCFDTTKQCALIAVDELINAFKELSIMESGGVNIDFGHRHWEEVKKELEKL